LLTHGWWFSPGTPASSTTKSGRHDIAEILLKVALNTKNQIKIKSNQFVIVFDFLNGSLFIYIFIVIGDSFIKRGIQLICITAPCFYAYPKSVPVIPLPYALVFFIFNDLKFVVVFVDIY
jgi:hypothetical protein